MEARLDLFGSELMTQFFGKLNGAGRVATRSGLPAATQELVKIRASQVNGCGVCTDMHTKEAIAAGESQLRLNLVAAWRDTTVFTPPERAALALAEEGTRLADGTGVSDEAWRAAREHYDDDQLAALVIAIAMINAWNRLNVITGTPGGSYEVGQFG
jgi:AhpD family alkylhydroperoxidase